MTTAPTPKRLQQKRTKGWRKPKGTICVGRGTRWGNPFRGSGDNPDRAMLARLYDEYLQRPEQAELVKAIKSELRGKDLCCWCPIDQPCHADVLIRLANGPSGELHGNRDIL